MRALSSAGSEHLVYTQRVSGSNPLAPTKKQRDLRKWVSFFIAQTCDKKTDKVLIIVWN